MRFRFLGSMGLAVAAVVAATAVGCKSSTGEPPGTGGGSAAECYDDKPGCVVKSNVERDVAPNVSDADKKMFQSDNASFAFDLERAIAKPGSNLIFSPYSISTALGMSYAGARTTTQDAMAKALHFELPQERLHPAFDWSSLGIAQLEQSSKDVEGGGFKLRTANALWKQIGLPLVPAYLDTLAKNYGASVRLADFSNAPQSAQLIDSWVDRQTDGKITDLVSPEDLASGATLVLVNAIYFKSAWATAFVESATDTQVFTRDDSSTVTASMMHGNINANQGAGDGYEAVEIPYAGTPVSMTIVMPTQGTAAAFEKSLDAAKLAAIDSTMLAGVVNVSMPKFHFGFRASLKEPLKSLGMEIAFTDGADFSGMFATSNGEHIIEVIHDAMIGVDEAGTEAAAATAVIMAESGSSGPGGTTGTIVLDHPFFFFIRDMPTGSILFAGKVSDPTAG